MQTWSIIEKLKNKIIVCRNRIERSIVGVKSEKDEIRLNKIQNVTKFRDDNKVCKKLKWEWLAYFHYTYTYAEREIRNRIDQYQNGTL